MRLLNIKYRYQVDGVLQGKRKSKLYNIDDVMTIEIMDASQEDMKLTALEVIDTFHGKMMIPYYEIDGSIYSASTLLYRGGDHKASEDIECLYKKINPDCNSNDYKERTKLSLEDFSNTNYFINFFECPEETSVSINDFKSINNTNKDYIQNYIRKICKKNLNVDGYLYEKRNYLYVNAKNLVDDKEEKHNDFFLPANMADIFPIKRTRFDLFVFNMSLIDNKEKYGYEISKLITDNFIFRPLGHISEKYLSVESFIQKMENYPFGPELIEKYNNMTNNPELNNVINFISFIADNINSFSKKDNYVGEIKRYDRKYASDYDIMLSIASMEPYINKILESYYRPVEEKFNAFSDGNAYCYDWNTILDKQSELKL